MLNFIARIILTVAFAVTIVGVLSFINVLDYKTSLFSLALVYGYDIARKIQLKDK